MGLLDKLFKKLSSGTIESDHLIASVRCKQCGEIIQVRVNLNNDLSLEESENRKGYLCRKGVMGSGEQKCYEKFELIMYFDRNRRYLYSDIAGKAELVSIN